MKKEKTILFIIVLCISFANAQIKVFPGGNVAFGNLTSPATFGVTHYFMGTKMTFLNNTNPIQSAPLIWGQNNFTNVSYTFWGDDQTGMGHPANNVLGFSVANTERLRIHSNGKSYFSTAPNTGSPWLDGVITGKNFNDNERIFSATHVSASTNWGQAVNVDLSRPLSVGYRCIVPGVTQGWYVTGFGWTFSAGSYIGSDASLKTNVSTITNALQTIKNLRGVKFNYLGEIANPSLFEGGVSQYYGFVAQETQTAIPGNGVVKTGENGTTKFVSYTSIIPFLVEAMKQQQSTIDSLKQQVADCCKSNNGNHNGQGNKLMGTGSGNNSENNSTESFLMQNTPNPFSKETNIKYFISEKDAISSMLIFDMNGKLLRTYKLSGAGSGSLNIIANDYMPGMYYYSLIVNNQEVDTKKMILTQD